MSAQPQVPVRFQGWVKGYQCTDCGCTIPEDHWTGPWDERVLEDPNATPGCPCCDYQTVTVPVHMTINPREVVR